MQTSLSQDEGISSAKASTPSRLTPSKITPSQFVPISQISTYTPRWTIKAKIVEKGMQTFTKRTSQGGGTFSAATSSDEGRILTTDLMDVQGDLIRAKFWGDAALKYDKILEKGKIYTFKGARVSVANKRYNNTPHAYELTFFHNGSAEISLCENDGSDELEGRNETCGRDVERDMHTPTKILWPSQPNAAVTKFVSIRDVKFMNRELPFLIDLLAVVHSFKPVEECNSKKSGELLKRRSLTVVDASEHQLNVTLWPPHTLLEDFEFAGKPVVAFRGLQIRDFRGRVGATVGISTLSVHPQLEEANKLAKWFKQNGDTVDFQSLKNTTGGIGQGGTGGAEPLTFGTLASVYEELQQMSTDEVKSFITIAQPSKFFVLNRDNEFTGVYTACPKCHKKVTENRDERMMRCENCSMSVEPIVRYMLAVNFVDHTRGKFISRAFHEACQAMIPVGADTWKRIASKKVELFDQESTEKSGQSISKSLDGSKDTLTDGERISQVFEHESLWKRMKIILKCRKEVYNGNERSNVVATYIEKLNLEEHAKHMLREIWRILPEARKASTFHAEESEDIGCVKRRKVPEEKDCADTVNTPNEKCEDPNLETAGMNDCGDEPMEISEAGKSDYKEICEAGKSDYNEISDESDRNFSVLQELPIAVTTSTMEEKTSSESFDFGNQSNCGGGEENNFPLAGAVVAEGQATAENSDAENSDAENSDAKNSDAENSDTGSKTAVQGSQQQKTSVTDVKSDAGCTVLKNQTDECEESKLKKGEIKNSSDKEYCQDENMSTVNGPVA